MPENRPPLPGFVRWPSFPFEGDMRVKRLAAPVDVEPPRSGEDAADCVACNTPDDAYIWVSERWRVRAMDQPTGLPVVLVLECRSHLDLGDLTNLLAAELGVMTVRVERAVRSLDGVARVHVNRWGDGSAHLHMWFLARPYGRLQLRGTFLSLWDDILPGIPEQQWRENLGHIAALLAEFGGTAIAEPPHIAWQAPGTMGDPRTIAPRPADRPQDLSDVEIARRSATAGPPEAVTSASGSDTAGTAVATENPETHPAAEASSTHPQSTNAPAAGLADVNPVKTGAPVADRPDADGSGAGREVADGSAEADAEGPISGPGDRSRGEEPGQATVNLLDAGRQATARNPGETTTHDLREVARRATAGSPDEAATHDLSASTRRLPTDADTTPPPTR